MPRTLALDFGLRRIGAAMSDPRRVIASPLEIYERQSEARDAKHYAKLVEDEDVDRIVVGLPVHTSGDEGELAEKARAWGRWLETTTNVPVFYFDERYTSVEAEELMRASGVRPRDRRALRDKIAAQILLQHYLDAGSPEVEQPQTPLNDPFDMDETS